jgi:magnesium transporter
MKPARSAERLQESLAQVQKLLEKHRVLEAMTHRQEGPKRDLLEALQHRQNLAELHGRLRSLHPADLAYVLEALPLDDRLLVWSETDRERAGQLLLETAAAVREGLLAATKREDLVAILETLDAEDLAWIADSLDEDVRREVFASLDESALSWVRSSRAFPEDSVGHLMSSELVSVRDTRTLGELASELRGRRELPPHTDALFVVDARNVLRGTLPLNALVLRDPASCASDALAPEAMAFTPEDPAAEAAQAFERYRLSSAPVVDERGKLLGRLTVDAVVDFIRKQSEIKELQRAGLAGEEDLFAPVLDSARNRWLWLAVNLVTAFLASRVIGLYEDAIASLAALATLMPIVASVGGNTGNQTVALMIRALTLGQLSSANARRVLTKELTVAGLNGLVWGGVMGLAASALYRSVPLGLVLAAAMLLNLMVSAMVGTAVPLLLRRAGRDPAQGSSVLLTFTTDSMGFFIFLALAKGFLL